MSLRESDVNAAVDALAGAVSQALRTSNGTTSDEGFSLVRDMPGRNGGTEARLAALRVLGADALAPFVLTGHVLADEDADLVRTAMRAHPAPDADSRLWGLRDWAVTALLRRLRSQQAPDAPAPQNDGAGLPWKTWCAELMGLSSLALPGVRSPLRAEVAGRGLDLARGLVRAVLRRDHLGAARLARWQALVDPGDPYLPATIDHLTQLAGDVPRVRLELTVAELLLSGSR